MARPRDLDDALELMHFGFRGIVKEPDRELARRGFGRVHHRVLYFIRRNQHLTIGELVHTLGITKQALHRPLSELVAAKLVVRSVDPNNRRFVRLSLSNAGAAFERRLSGLQRDHFARVFERVGDVAESGWREVMRALAESS